MVQSRRQNTGCAPKIQKEDILNVSGSSKCRHGQNSKTDKKII